MNTTELIQEIKQYKAKLAEHMDKHVVKDWSSPVFQEWVRYMHYLHNIIFSKLLEVWAIDPTVNYNDL